MTQIAKRAPRFLLLMPDDVREEIERAATANNRTITKEINTRLRNSLIAHGPTLQRILNRDGNAYQAQTQHVVQDPAGKYLVTQNDQSPANTLTDIDRAMLAVFRAMPPEKQLALLSLFK